MRQFEKEGRLEEKEENCGCDRVRGIGFNNTEAFCNELKIKITNEFLALT